MEWERKENTIENTRERERERENTREGRQQQAAHSPAGKEMPMGNRVCESPPVPTVSGMSILLSHEWMIPSPGRRDTPPRVRIKSGSVCCVAISMGLGYAAVWQNDCITRSAMNPRQARSLSSSRVIGPVVS